jgi:fructose-specific phosphotransferase system IIA component
MIRTMNRLSEYLRKDLIIYSLKGKKAVEILEEFAQLLYSKNLINDKDKFLDELLIREELGSTAIDNGIAIPHCKLDEVNNTFAVIGISRKGVNFNSVDDKPTYLFFLLVSPQKSTEEHLSALAAISHIARQEKAKKELIDARNAVEIIKVIQEWENRD